MGRSEFRFKMTLADHLQFSKGFAGTSIWDLTAAQRALLIGPSEREKRLRGRRLYSQDELEALVRANSKSTEERLTPPDVTDDIVTYGEALNGAEP